MELDLAGKTALVTGASGGIGAACAELLAREGVRVRVTARSADALDALVVRIRAAGGEAEAIAGDVTDPVMHERLAPDGAEPDLYVHAAGHRFAYAKLHAEEESDAEATRKVDHESFAAICKRILPAMMVRRHGRIVAISSIGALLSGVGTPRYTAAKAAVEGLVRAIAVDYGRYGITANAVAPGFVRTERLGLRAGDEREAALVRATSVRRLGEPGEIAAAVAYLCSRRAGFVTGTTMIVDGGTHLNNMW